MYVQSSKAEKEVEKLFRQFIPTTTWKGKLFSVGGYVRDEYLRQIKNDPTIEPKDLDIVVDSPEGGGAEKATSFISDYFNSKQPSSVTHPHKMGEAYPIYQLTFKEDITFNGKKYETKGAQIEFADSQKESFPDEKSRQRVVSPGTLQEDVKRRDFTVNSLLKDLTTGEVKDMTGVSKKDIEQGILRGHPEVSPDAMFSSDPLRMLRLLRFRCKYKWTIPQDVKDAVARNAERISIISSERIMGELEKISDYGKLSEAVRLMDEMGLLKYILPEIDAMKGVQQPKEWHGEGDVYTHTLNVLDNTGPGLERQFAALLHDVGKPSTTKIIGDEITSHGHADVGSEMARAILNRLRFKSEIVSKIVKIVQHHMQPYNYLGELKRGVLSDKTIRKFIRKLGQETVDAILELSKADEMGSLPNRNEIPDLINRINEAKRIPVSPKAILNGKEIMSLLGIPQGPEIGKVSDFLIDLADDYAQQGKTLTKDEATQEMLRKFKGEAARKVASMFVNL